MIDFSGEGARRSSLLRAKEGFNAMTNFHYVYVLQSLSHPSQIYTGITADLKKRLAELMRDGFRTPPNSRLGRFGLQLRLKAGCAPLHLNDI